MIGRSALDLPSSIATKTYLASPFAISDIEALKQQSVRLRQQNIELDKSGLASGSLCGDRYFCRSCKTVRPTIEQSQANEGNGSNT